MAEGQKMEEAKKKPALSSRLMQMKFMQRGKEKAVLKETIAEQVVTSVVSPHGHASSATDQDLCIQYHALPVTMRWAHH